MNSAFSQTIENSSAGKKSRDNITSLVIKNPEYVNDLASIAFDPTHKNHYKAIWIFELLAEQKIELLLSYIDSICKTAPKYQHESAIRGISRIVCFISNSKMITLTENQKDTLIEICLDWLIGDAKVAPKMYAMYALSHFMSEQNWLKEELQNIIDKDYHAQSAGYKAAAREVLKRIKRQ